MLKKIYAKIIQAKNPIALPDGLAEQIVGWVEGVYWDSMNKSNKTGFRIASRGIIFDWNCTKKKVFNLTLPEKANIPLIVRVYGVSFAGVNNPIYKASARTTNNGKPEIWLWMARNEELVPKGLEIMLQETISHELTHCVESFINPNHSNSVKDKIRKNYKEYSKYQEFYHNSDFEVNAFGREIYEISKRNTQERIPVFLDFGNSIEEIIKDKNSLFWIIYNNIKWDKRDIYKYTDEKNSKKFSQLAFRGFEEGFELAIQAAKSKKQ